MPAATSSWMSLASAPIAKSARRGSLWRPQGVEPLSEVQLSLGLGAKAHRPASPGAAAPTAKPSLLRQLAMGSCVFAGILTVSVPLVLVSKGLALGTAVGLGVLLVALLARRLLVTPVIAAVLAILGAFATAQSVHASYTDPVISVRPGASPATAFPPKGSDARP